MLTSCSCYNPAKILPSISPHRAGADHGQGKHVPPLRLTKKHSSCDKKLARNSMREAEEGLELYQLARGNRLNEKLC